MSIEVRPAAGKAAKRAFIAVPHAVYRGDPNWVAPLDFERMEHLDPAKNAFFANAEVELFIAWRDGAPAGRISAQIDRFRLAAHNDATGQFGFIDAIDDPEVFAALFAAAEAWLRARGMLKVQGPFSFSINEETGLLIEGFERPPVVMMGHARPYYRRHIEALGYGKVKDVYAYDIGAIGKVPPAMASLVARARASGKMVVRPFDKKHMRRDLGIIIDIFNDAWSDNWGFIPWASAERDIQNLSTLLNVLVSNQCIAIAEHAGRPAAMIVSLPDINEWIADLHGSLLPFGWARLAWRLFTKVPHGVRVPLMGIRKEYQNTPFGLALAAGVIDAIRVYHEGRGSQRCEMSWILEDNRPMRHIIEKLGGVAYKTYRIYEKALV